MLGIAQYMSCSSCSYQIKKEGIGTVYCYPPTQVSVIDAAAMGEALETFTVCASPIQCIATVPGFNENDPDVLTSKSFPVIPTYTVHLHFEINFDKTSHYPVFYGLRLFLDDMAPYQVYICFVISQVCRTLVRSLPQLRFRIPSVTDLHPNLPPCGWALKLESTYNVHIHVHVHVYMYIIMYTAVHVVVNVGGWIV